MKHLLQHFKTLSKHPQNAEELKSLILDLALRGKLTNDFNKERIQSIADKTEGYYELPADWYWDEFDNLVDFQMGKTPPSKRFEFWEGDHPWISIADMDTYKTIYETKKTLSDLGLKNYFKNGLVKQGTLIMSFKLTIGKTSILGVDACHNEAIISIYPGNEITQDYLFRFLPIISNWGVQVNALMGKTLNKGKIQRLKIPVPPLEEQKAIVEIVNKLFKEVEQLEEQTKTRIQLKKDFATSALQRLSQADNLEQEWQWLQSHFTEFFTEKENVKQLRDAILQLAVQGKLTSKWRARHPEFVSGPHHASELLKRIQTEKQALIAQKKIKKEKPLPPITKEDIPYELPEGWVWCRLQDLVNVGTGSTPPKSNSSYYNGTIPWYTSSATNDLYAKESEKLITEKALQETNCKVFPKGTLIIAMYGQGKTRGQISELVIPGATNQAVAAMVFYKTSKDFKEYIKYFFRKIYDEIRLLAEGGAQPNLNVGKIKNTILPLPPLEEQKAIVEKVNALMALCDSLEEHIENSHTQITQLMQSCLREVFEERVSA
ncbi:restriction endonuclease subunit S [Seonamhaeicola sp. NFXS20]|uniref:restriction endonuclease subunit S n=1 Tax=Seonamhaeicola sp. NFXS20 TaxID=2816959 RepID=UPI003B8BAD11